MIPRVSLDDALAFLLSLVGDRVDVAVESPASGLVAHFSGELRHGHELGTSGPADPLFFSFADGASGFVVVPTAFGNARRAADGSSIRIEDRGGVALTIERARPSDRGT
jgi:hypothetical protein